MKSLLTFDWPDWWFVIRRRRLALRRRNSDASKESLEEEGFRSDLISAAWLWNSGEPCALVVPGAPDLLLHRSRPAKSLGKFQSAQSSHKHV